MTASRPFKQMPGPWEPAFLQVLGWLTRPDFYERIAHRYGRVFRLKFPFWGDVPVFTTAHAVQEILKLPASTAHSGLWHTAEGIGRSALPVLDEDEHWRMRKLAMPPITGNRLKAWESLIVQRTLADVERFPIGEPFSIKPIADEITTDVLAEVLFGIRDMAHGPELRQLLPTLYTLSGPIVLGFMSRWGRMDLGPRSPWGRYSRNRDRIDELLYAEIAHRRRKLGDSTETAGSDLLSALLLARDEDGRGLSNTEVRDQVVSMLVAGQTTTPTSIAWALERLVRNPTVMAALLESLDEGDTAYLDAVIKETLRCRAVAHAVPRLLAEDAVIDGWALPAGTNVHIALPLLHNDPQTYPEPDQFRPERFLHGDDPGHGAWLAFGGGVRRCTGASLATLQMRVVLATILRRVRLVPDVPESEKPTGSNVKLVPNRGARVIVARSCSS